VQGMMRLLSANVGTRRSVVWQGRQVSTAIFKHPAGGPRFVGRINVDGDDQADRVAHWGEHRAVFVYQISPIATGRSSSAATTSASDSSERTSPSRGLADDEVCMVTASGSAVRCSRSPSRG
jgi:hypothetical protein